MKRSTIPMISRRSLACSFVIIVMMLTILSTPNSFCNEKPALPKVEKTFPVDSLNRLIADNLITKKIVMLPDGWHGDYYYMKTVVSFLHYWIEQSDRHPVASLMPKKLFLILEMDKETENAVNAFMKTDDVAQLCKFLIEYNGKYTARLLSIDYIRFIQELHEIKSEIDRSNHQHPKYSLELRIVGVEPAAPYSVEEMLSMPPLELKKRSLLWFVHERDRISAKSINTLLTEHPGFKGLGFYGEGHLGRYLVQKAVDLPKEIADIPDADYFQAHFLDSLYGRKHVSTFMLDFGQRSDFQGDSRSVIQQMEPLPESADYLIPYNRMKPVLCPFFFIKGKNTLTALVDGIEKYGQGKSKSDQALTHYYVMNLFYQLCRSYLWTSPETRKQIFSIAQGTPPEEYKAYLLKVVKTGRDLVNSFDAVENIKRTEEWFLRPARFDSSTYIPMARQVFQYLPQSDTTSDEQQAFKDGGKYIRKEMLIQYSLINLLWIATPEEKAAAMQFLHAATGLNFTTAEQWNNWFQIKKYKKETE